MMRRGKGAYERGGALVALPFFNWPIGVIPHGSLADWPIAIMAVTAVARFARLADCQICDWPLRRHFTWRFVILAWQSKGSAHLYLPIQASPPTLVAACGKEG